MAEKNKDEIEFHLFGLVFHLHKKKYMGLLWKIWLALALLLSISVLFFGYEMTNADIPGGLIAGALLAYLIHIIQN